MPSVFLSYSRNDKTEAEAIAQALRQYGIEVWVDNEQIEPGDGISDEISTGLREADALLFLLSEASINSPWCRKEYQAVLEREIETGETRVIPVKLDDVEPPPLLTDKKHVQLQSPIDKDCVAEVAAKIQSLPDTRVEMPTNSKNEKRSIEPLLVKSLVFLLLLDRFDDEGVWGRSMAEISGAYGHEEDPGSITISTWAIRGLNLVTESAGTEVTDLCSYLSRRTASSGAIGMKREIGDWLKRSVIVPNRRHTAVGAEYLRKYCGALDCAFKSMRYVIQHRTEKGAWSAMGDVSDETADPLTTAYVLRVLRNYENEGLLDKITIPRNKDFSSEYWKAGLLWLYRFLNENDGWWLYKGIEEKASKQVIVRKFSYTTNILMLLPEFTNEHPDYSDAHRDILTRLKDIWENGEPGLPTGPTEQTPELGTTFDYVRAVWICREHYPDLAEELTQNFIDQFAYFVTEADSDATGWSKSLVFLSELGTIPDFRIDSESVRRDVQTTKERYNDSRASMQA